MSTNKRKTALTAGEKLIFLAGILFCLILITTAMMGGLFARYVSTGAAEDAARVAKWDLAVALNPLFEDRDDETDVVKVLCRNTTDSGTFDLAVTNNSEVAVSYELVITLAAPLPAGVSVKLDGTELAAQDLDDPIEFTYRSTKDLLPNSGAVEHDMTFSVDWAGIDFTAADTDDIPDEETLVLDFTVDATIVQID